MSKKLQLIPLIFCLLIGSKLSAQSFIVSGYISNSYTGEVIIGAYVFCPQTGSGSVSNNYGYYAINIPYGTKNLVFIREGFDSKIDTIRISGNHQLDIRLTPSNEDEYANNPITIPIDSTEINLDDAPEKIHQIKNTKKTDALIRKALTHNLKIIDRVNNGLMELPGQQIKSMPSLLGEVDVVRSLKHLPGVMPGTELTNGMYVRGGGQDQNLVMIDGIPIYNMNHAFGFYSIFNAEGISNISLTKSGYSARYGGRLSAITDVSMKEGANNTIHGIFTQSMVALTLNLDGPLSKDGRTRFSVAARRSYLDLLLLRPVSDDTSKTIYTFYDFNFKLSHSIDNRNKLFYSFYSNRDRLYSFERKEIVNSFTKINEASQDIRWGNFANSIKWNKSISNRLFSNLVVNYSQYKSAIGLGFSMSYDSAGQSDYSKITYKYLNFIRDFQPGIHYDYLHNKTHTFKFGSELSIKSFLPGRTKTAYENNGVVSNDTAYGIKKSIGTQELALYFEDELKLSAKFKTNIGGRLVNFFSNGQHFLFLEPRWSWNKKINNAWALKGSYTIMNQNLHLLADNINSNVFALNFDRWVPANGLIKPQRAQQVNLGISAPLENNWEFTIDGYYKWFNRVLEVKQGADISGGLLDNSIWENQVINGKGWNYGIETFLHKRKGDFSGWMNYTLSWAKRNTPGINRDETYYFQFDRRHYFNLVLQTKLDDVYSASVNVVYSTGNFQSVPIGKYRDINGNIVYDYTEKNNYRLDHTFRIDVGVNKIKFKDWAAESGYRFSVYNLLARNNPAYIYIDNSQSPPKAYQRSFLMFIPGVTYYIKF